MRVQILSLLGVVLFFSACNKNDDPVTGGGPDPVVPTLFLSSVLAMGDSAAFDYNNDKMLTRSAYFVGGNTDIYSTSIYTLAYESGKLKQYNFTTNVAAAGTPRYEVKYNSAGLAEKLVHTDANADGAYDSIAYNNEGKVAAFYNLLSAGKSWSYSTVFIWEGNNVAKTLDISQGINGKDTIVTTYTYDDKRNAFASVAPYCFFMDDFSYYLSANNVTEKKWVASPAQTITTTYAYSYNSDNYPVTAKMKEVSIFDGEVVTHSYDHAFHYLPK